MKPTHKDTRHYTNMLLEKIEEGTLDKDTVITAFCSYLSEDDVYDMMQANEMLDLPCMECGSTEELDETGLCEDCTALQGEDEDNGKD